MKTVLMAIAIVRKDDTILMRKMDPERNPYQEPWGLFGGRLEGEGDVGTLLNKELSERWNFTVSIIERTGWDEDLKKDHDGETKRFIYVDAICSLDGGSPSPVNKSEQLEWVHLDELKEYSTNPPTSTVLKQLGYIA